MLPWKISHCPRASFHLSGKPPALEPPTVACASAFQYASAENLWVPLITLLSSFLTRNGDTKMFTRTCQSDWPPPPPACRSSRRQIQLQLNFEKSLYKFYTSLTNAYFCNICWYLLRGRVGGVECQSVNICRLLTIVISSLLPAVW